MPVAIQVALYAAIAILLSVAALVGVLIAVRKPLGRVVGAADQFNVEAAPLTRDAGVAVKRLGDLSGPVDPGVREIGAAVEPPPVSAVLGMRFLRRALESFAGARESNRRKKRESEAGMSEVTQSSVKGILVAAVVGAAVGAGIAILFAPCSGKETRGWLMHKTREIKERTTSAIEHGKDAARRAMREIRRDGELAATGAERPVYSETGAAAKTA